MAAVKERERFSFDSTRVSVGWYNELTKTIEVEFVDGTHWMYRECSVQTWANFKRSKSPGRFIFDILDRHPHNAR